MPESQVDHVRIVVCGGHHLPWELHAVCEIFLRLVCVQVVFQEADVFHSLPHPWRIKVKTDVFYLFRLGKQANVIIWLEIMRHHSQLLLLWGGISVPKVRKVVILLPDHMVRRMSRGTWSTIHMIDRYFKRGLLILSVSHI